MLYPEREGEVTRPMVSLRGCNTGRGNIKVTTKPSEKGTNVTVPFLMSLLVLDCFNCQFDLQTCSEEEDELQKWSIISLFCLPLNSFNAE